MMAPDSHLDRLYAAVVDGDAPAATEAAGHALAAGLTPAALLYEAMIPALEEVGSRYETGEVFLPEMLIAARAMQAVMEEIRPLLVEGGIERAGTFVMGTVAGDIHDVGKNLVIVMLEGAGFEVVDLGINVAADTFVAAIRTHRPDVVGLSAFLTTTLPEVTNTIDRIAKAGLRDQVKILIGGAPVSQLTVEESGADGFAPDASSAVRLTKSVLGLRV